MRNPDEEIARQIWLDKTHLQFKHGLAAFKEKNMDDFEYLRYIGWREMRLTEGWISTPKDKMVYQICPPPKLAAPHLHIDRLPNLAIETITYTKRTIWHGTKEVAKFWAPGGFSDERAIAGFFNSQLANQ